jgi:hypothetical protein
MDVGFFSPLIPMIARLIVLISCLFLSGGNLPPAMPADSSKPWSRQTNADGHFGATRLGNYQTVDMQPKGSLEFRIAHRFASLNSGFDNLFGVDGPANIRLGFDYSLSDKLAIGIGRSSSRRLIDGFFKYRFLDQNKGKWISMAWISTINIFSGPNQAGPNGYPIYQYFSSRLVYMHQLLISRKFHPKFSAQISPTFIHFNLVENLSDKNDMFCLPILLRWKIGKNLSLFGEYGIRLTPYVRDKSLYYNAASFGLSIETGAHVFQVMAGNSQGLNEVMVLPYTTSGLEPKLLRFGFAISRLF